MKDLKYEDAVKELSIIVEKMEKGEVSLEETVKYYEEGQKLLQFCKDQLNSAEGKLKKLSPTGNTSEI
ncbi:MAG: exodeoxyribonuclease VII small subunit [Candidatus Delongbacteria bacterium]|nr:MAG: exodeoxyribonuclease VII small subunit [Candidatus Delongbacteria bacterium]